MKSKSSTRFSAASTTTPMLNRIPMSPFEWITGTDTPKKLRARLTT
jgi:hypothetical protein